MLRMILHSFPAVTNERNNSPTNETSVIICSPSCSWLHTPVSRWWLKLHFWVNCPLKLKLDRWWTGSEDGARLPCLCLLVLWAVLMRQFSLPVCRPLHSVSCWLIIKDPGHYQSSAVIPRGRARWAPRLKHFKRLCCWRPRVERVEVNVGGGGRAAMFKGWSEEVLSAGLDAETASKV